MSVFFLSLIASSVLMTTAGIFLLAAVRNNMLRKISPSGRALLWLVLIIGLLFPVKPAILPPVLEISTPYTAWYMQSSTGAPESSPLPEAGTTVNDKNNEISGGSKPGAGSFTKMADTSARQAGEFIGKAVIFLWFLGVVAVLLHGSWKWGHFRKMRNRWCIEERNPLIAASLETAKIRMGIKKGFRIYSCPFISTPMLTGLIHPVILVPDRLSYAPEEMVLILSHELAHYRRHDLWGRLAASAALALHWFNPALRCMVREYTHQCELACDAAVLRGADRTVRVKYASILLGAARHPVRTYPLSAGIHLTGNLVNMKERIRETADQLPKQRGITAAAVMCALVIFSGSVTSFAAPKISDEIYPYQTTTGEVEIVSDYLNSTMTNPSPAEVPDGYHEVSAPVSEDEITYQLVASLYKEEGLDIQKDRLAIRMKGQDLALIAPDNLIPFSPMTGGTPPWLIKAWVYERDLWSLMPPDGSMESVRDRISDILLETVSQNYASREAFEKAARERLTDALGSAGAVIELDILDM